MSYWWAMSIFEDIPHSLELLLNYRLAWKPCVLTERVYFLENIFLQFGGN